MNKFEIYEFLRNGGIWHEVTEHEAVFTMQELSSLPLPYPKCDAKNLFVKDDKKLNYYLITLKGDKKVDLKNFRTRYNTRRLSFASESDLSDILGVIAGSVSPFGILNDRERKVQFCLDKDFLESPGIIGVHPNDNTATVCLKTQDLVSIIEQHGNKVTLVNAA